MKPCKASLRKEATYSDSTECDGLRDDFEVIW